MSRYNENTEDYSYVRALICPKCKKEVGIEQPYISHFIFNCSFCEQGFIFQRKKLLSINKYLDPENILNLKDEEDFSVVYTNQLRKEQERKEIGEFSHMMSFQTVYCGSYQEWGRVAQLANENKRTEESIFAYIHALHDYPANPTLWGNLALSFNFFLWPSMAEKCHKVIKMILENTQAHLAHRGMMEPRYIAEYQRDLPIIMQMDAQIAQKIQETSLIIKNQFGKETRETARALQRMAFNCFKYISPKRAKRRAHQVLRIDKNISDTWSLLGSLSLMEINYHNAADKYLHAVEVNPNQANYWLNLTMSLIGLKYCDQAMECIEISIKHLPNNTGLIRFHGMIKRHYEQGTLKGPIEGLFTQDELRAVQMECYQSEMQLKHHQ